MKFDRRHYTILAVMITEVLGFSLILPFLPFLAQDLGANPFEVGLIIASFSLFQFFSAPIMGKLSDKYGRRPLLLLSQASTLVSFVILGFAHTLWVIILSRIVDGILGSNQTIAQAYLSDISSKKDRSVAMGISGMAFGMGFLVGPATGGFLAQYSYALPSFLAAGMALVTMLTTYFFLPETVKNGSDKDFKISFFEWKSFAKYFTQRKVGNLLMVFGAYVTALFIFTSNLALFTERQVGFGAAEVGYMLALVGLISMVFRSPLLRRMIDIFGERELTIAGVGMVALGLFMTAFINQGWQFLLTTIVFALGSALSRPLLMGEISRNVIDEEQGAVMGITSSLGSFSRIVGPLVGGFMLYNFFPGSLPLLSGGLMLLGLWLLVRAN